jgi:hypothetical protein
MGPKTSMTMSLIGQENEQSKKGTIETVGDSDSCALSVYFMVKDMKA